MLPLINMYYVYDHIYQIYQKYTQQVLPVLAAALIFCHGIFDFYEAADMNFSPPIFNITYQTTIILYVTLLICQPALGAVGFILATMYHFGEDIRYILDGGYLERLLGIVLIARTSLNPAGQKQWYDFIARLYNPRSSTNNRITTLTTPIHYKTNINAIVNMLQYLGVLSAIWYIWWTELGVIGYCALILVGTISHNLGPDIVEPVFMTGVHVPLAAYRAWVAFGWPPIVIWIVVSMVISAVVISYGNTSTDLKYIIRQFIGNVQYWVIAITIPHIVTTTMWQLWQLQPLPGLSIV